MILLDQQLLTTAAVATIKLEVLTSGIALQIPPGFDGSLGVGTYSNPLTFASASGEFSSCEIIYLPYLKKYIRYEDYCAQCST